MARENSNLDDDRPATTGPERGESGSNEPLLGRRSYLKLAGTASAAGAAFVAGAGSAAAEEYEVIRADNSIYRLSDGEVFENKIIDFSNGNYFMLYARDATNWTIRNVGFRGTHRHDRHAIAVADVERNTSTIENVYMADGCVRPSSYSSHGQCAIWVAPEHNGHIDIKNCNIQDWPNNGIYASAPGYNGKGGTVHIDNCYAANNYVSSYRLSSNGSKCTNSVAYNDGNGRYRGRCFWGWNPGKVTISNCDFSSGSYPDAIHLGRSGSRTDVAIENTRYDGVNESGNVNISWGSGNGSNANLSMPDGVPTSAEGAASGEGGSGGSGGSDDSSASRGDHDDLQYTFEFVNDGDEPTDYYFEIEDGPIEPSTYNGASIEEDFMWVSEDGTRAAGRVAGGRHAWEFDTLLVDVTVDGEADVLVDDSSSNLSRYPRSGATGDDWKGNMPWHTDYPDLQHTFEFVAEDETEPTDYYFEIDDGPIEPSTYKDATVESEFMWVSEDGTRAAGRVAGGRHAWEFDTLLVDVTVDGEADVLVDDSPSNLSRYPQPGAAGDDWKGDMPWHGEKFDHTILLDGVGTTGKSRYEFTVTGDVEPTTYRAASIDSDTEIDGGHVTGSVRGWRDAFAFDGDLDALTLDGDARVLLDDETVDPSEYGDGLEHVLTIVGNGSSATYEVSVSGEIETLVWDDFDDLVDVIDEGTVSGSIESGVQRFRFSGAVTDLTFAAGSAHVYADQDRIRPDDF